MPKGNISKKSYKKNRNVIKVSGKRMILILVLLIFLFVILIGRIGYIQFVQGAWLKQREYSQSTSNTVISARRGTIYDSNGKALAISAAVDTVSINPQYINVKEDGVINKEKTNELKEKMANAFSEIILKAYIVADELNYEDVLAKLNREKNVETIVSKVETDKVEILKKWLEENNASAGVNIDEDTKRYYPATT